MHVAVPDHVLVQHLEDELVLLNTENGRYFGLDSVGAYAWQALSQHGDTEVAFAQLCKEYAVDDATLRRDLAELLQQLTDAGLLVAVS
jgi:aryl carrier-like protein